VADALTDLLTNGVDDTGTVASSGAVDPHYVFISSADPSYPGPPSPPFRNQRASRRVAWLP